MHVEFASTSDKLLPRAQIRVHTTNHSHHRRLVETDLPCIEPRIWPRCGWILVIERSPLFIPFTLETAHHELGFTLEHTLQKSSVPLDFVAFCHHFVRSLHGLRFEEVMEWQVDNTNICCGCHVSTRWRCQLSFHHQR